MRTLTIILVSCLLGVGVGFGSAVSALTINAWNPKLEYKKHADLIRDAGEQASNPNAKAQIDETVFDFGLRNVKEKGTHDFTIKNVGTAPLTLQVNRTTCTCTGIDLSVKWGITSQSVTVSPGQSATASLHYDAERATAGAYNQGGTLVSNDPDNREIYLSVKGVFTAPIVLSPSSLFFPTVPARGTQSATLRIYGFEKTPLRLEEAEWNDRTHFDLQLKRSELDDADKEHSMNRHATSVYEAVATVKPGLPVGTFQEKFYVRTNYPTEPSFEFMIRGQIAGSGITISGMGFDKETGVARLGKTLVGQRLTKDLMIQFQGTAALEAELKVRSVKPEWLKVTLTQPHDIGAASSRRRFYTMTVEVPVEATVGNYTRIDEDGESVITLETGLEDSPTLRIPVQFVVER